MTTFQGVWPALVTPFTSDDRVNIAVARNLVEHSLARGLQGFYVCGSTGQGLFMSVEERKLMVETVIQQVGDRAPVVVHIGSHNVKDAEELACHAQQVGASAISSVIPAYFDNEAAIFAYYQRVAAAAPNIPLWPYLWSQTSDRLAYTKLLMRIPTITGVKYTGPNMYEMQQIMNLRQESWTVFSGMDEQSVFAAQLGVAGAIGSTQNILPGLFSNIRKLVQARETNQAVELQDAANRIIAMMYRYGYRGALNEILHQQGFDCGQPRLPGLPFPAEKREVFCQELEALDFARLSSL